MRNAPPDIRDCYLRLFARLAEAPFPDGEVKYYYKPHWIELEEGDPAVLTLYADDECTAVYYLDADAGTIEIASLYHPDE